MNRTELRFTLNLIPFLDSMEDNEDGMVKLRDRRWLVWHPDVMAALFRTDRDLRHPPSRTLSPLLGNRSVLWLDGAEHTAYRRALAPALRGNRYQALIEEIVERSVAELPHGDPVGLAAWTRTLTLRIIGRIVFGVDDDELLTAFTRWLDRRLRSRVRTLAHRYFTPGTTRFDPELDRLLLTRAREAEPPALAAFLPPDDLRDQVVSLLFAGHETTASATAWTLYWIDRTPGLAGPAGRPGVAGSHDHGVVAAVPARDARGQPDERRGHDDHPEHLPGAPPCRDAREPACLRSHQIP